MSSYIVAIPPSGSEVRLPAVNFNNEASWACVGDGCTGSHSVRELDIICYHDVGPLANELCRDTVVEQVTWSGSLRTPESATVRWPENIYARTVEFILDGCGGRFVMDLPSSQDSDRRATYLFFWI